MPRTTKTSRSLRPDDTVRTPSGATAVIVEIDEGLLEALVQWPNGERAHFRLSRLTWVPKP